MASNPVLQTLRSAWMGLEALHAPMAVMGGIALSTWEYVRATEDVDVLVSIEHSKISELVTLLERTGFRPKRSPPALTLGEMCVVQFVYEPAGTHLEMQLDVLVGTSEFQKCALSRRVKTRLPDLDIEIAVLSCEDLILHKLIAGRIIDRGDCIALIKANIATLDRSYLVAWADRSGLRPALDEVWQTAAPSNRLPS